MGVHRFPQILATATPINLVNKVVTAAFKSKPEPESQAKYLCDRFPAKPHADSDYAKREKEPVASTRIACITDPSSSGMHIKTVRGYWERFETCNLNNWFTSFYVLSSQDYYSVKSKCGDENAFVQPINMKNLTIYSALRMDDYSFAPAILNLYTSNTFIEKVTIKKYKWMLKDLYQLCKEVATLTQKSEKPYGRVEIEIMYEKEIFYTLTKTDGSIVTDTVEKSKYYYAFYTVKMGSDMVFKVVKTGITITIRVTDATRGVHCNHHVLFKTQYVCEEYGTKYQYRLPPIGETRTHFGTYPNDLRSEGIAIGTRKDGHPSLWGREIKGLWEIYYLCNCKVRLPILSLSSDGVKRYTIIRETMFAKPGNVWTNIQVTNYYHQSLKLLFGLFVQRNNMTFMGGVIWNHNLKPNTQFRQVKDGSTFKTLYNILC